METNRWSAARALFDQAVALPEAERAAFVASNAGHDPELRAELVSLLDALAGAGGFLAGTNVGALAELPGQETAEPDRERIGAWQVVSVLGRGGMGVVYLAERAAGDYEQKAAIKVVAGGVSSRLGSSAIVRRFETERRLLASLDHPGIARLLDGGTTEDGLPYFVLEYVEGQELLSYCDGAQLDIERRLRIFLEICAAIEHAHARLVLHRDLKPSNILVGAHGRPKLLDFGIGKLVQPGAGEVGAAETATFDRWMTPHYASPEQILGQPSTTATDVYGLGVVLFELLTGAKPYRFAGTGPRDIEQAILEQTPRRLSSVITESPGRAAAMGEPSPARLRRFLRGDLETIVAKALEREPARRYASVADLSADLERFLAGRPVMARPASRRYRLAKFVQRHRLAVASAAVAALAVGGLVAYHVKALERERDVARREAANATEIASFLTKLFQGANLVQTGGATLSARDLLDRGEKQLDERTDLDPTVRGRLLVTMSLARESLGDPKRAHELAEQAARLHESAGSPAEDRVFSQLLQAKFLIGEGRGLHALPILERAASLAQANSEVSLKTRGKVALLLGNVYYFTGDEAKAKSAYEKHIEIEKQIGLSARIGSALNNLGALLVNMGDDAGARALFRESISNFERSTEIVAYEIYLPLYNLAELQLRAGELDAAEASCRRGMEAHDKVFGAEGSERIWGMALLADIERRRGRLEQARESIDRTLALCAKVLEPEHTEWSWPLEVSGRIYIAAGNRAAAIVDLERALAIERNQDGDRSDWIRPIETDLAEARGSAPPAD